MPFDPGTEAFTMQHRRLGNSDLMVSEIILRELAKLNPEDPRVELWKIV